MTATHTHLPEDGGEEALVETTDALHPQDGLHRLRLRLVAPRLQILLHVLGWHADEAGALHACRACGQIEEINK